MFHVNGHPCRTDADEQTPLLSVLRDELALSGPKFGCGQGECGACVVLVDGQPQASCNLPIWSVQGKQVVTLEGLGTPERPHPLQAAFIEERAAQCGYCVAGIVTAAAALLEHNPEPEPRADRAGARQAPVPLRRAQPDDPRGAARGGDHATEERS